MREEKEKLVSEYERLSNQFKNQYKREFYIPNEIVGLVVGSSYNKIKKLSQTYNVNIKVHDENTDDVQTKITISGDDREYVDEIEKKLHIQKFEKELTKNKVSFLIGKGGERIKQIIE